MPLYQPTIPYRYFVPLIQILREQDPEAAGDIMAAAGLEGLEVEPADASLPMARFDDLLVGASAQLQRTDLGFEMGKRITIESHSPLGKILQQCSTLEEMMLLIQRYYHLITPAFAVRYLPGKEHCEWRIRLAATMTQPTLYMFLEMHAVSVHVDLHRLFGLDAVFDIYLSAPPPPHRARYDRLPCTRFHFSSEALPEVRCVIPTQLVRRRLARGRGAAVAADGSARVASSPGLQTADRYGDWVSLMLREANTLQPTVAQLAALLNMAHRTLARRLADEGINFRELSTRIRHERACAMLADPSVPLHQIAYQLGYGDITAFIRGFRRASGLTPAEYRERATS